MGKKIKEEEKVFNQFLNTYIGSSDFVNTSERLGLFSSSEVPIYQYKRLETRTRKENPTSALSFAVHDPLWMLTRQWQFGEFKGDDCGSAIWAKIKIKHAEISALSNGKQSVGIRRDDAMEYLVERMNHEITDAIRVESAYYLKKSIDFSSLKQKSSQRIPYWQSKYPLEAFPDITSDLSASDKTPKECIAEIKKRKNTHLETFLAAFGNRSFDGYRLFLDIQSQHISDERVADILTPEEQTIFATLCQSYAKWFKKTYLPIEDETNFWVDEKLGYELSVSVDDAQRNHDSKNYSVEDYHSGRLSWYSFDMDSTAAKINPSENRISGTGKEAEIGKVIGSLRPQLKEKIMNPLKSKIADSNEKYFSFIPVLAEFPGSPNKRLWAFEDAKISMGNSELSADSLANAVILQYTTMYGNDWLITPMELNAGKVSEVKGIIVTDVFGTSYFIDRQAGETTSPQTRYSGKWEMFTISKKYAYEKQDFQTDGCLFFPPSLARSEESAPVEEVQFLRDEMANMLWAVEMRVNGRCGKSLDGDNFAAEIEEELQTLTPNYGEAEETKADYSYLFQNSVPLNWIPFSPVKFKPGEANAIREIRFQRSTMPLFIKDRFEPIRPSTWLMRTGIDENDDVKKHKFINEEEILAVGTKVTINNQRTRWFNGKTFNWLGAKKEVSRSQANSGLSFDELVEVISKSASEVDLKKDEKTPE